MTTFEDLAHRADEAGIKTCVVSTDRDEFQLVSENVCLMMTPRGVADVNVYTPERVEARLDLGEHTVDVESNPAEALFHAAEGNYDLLIADLKMPGVDGLTVIREAKRYKADLPVIIITGFSTESSAIEAVNLGVAGYLTKPFRVPQVLAAAAKALGE